MSQTTIESVLFCCTGNIFRSLTAEHALRRALGPNARIAVSSAGTEDVERSVFPSVRDYLQLKGYDVSAHRRRTVTRAILDGVDLIVAMSEDHREFLQAHFGCRAPLFLEVCGLGSAALPDVDEAVPDYVTNHDAATRHIRHTIDLIVTHIPELAWRLRAGDSRLAIDHWS